MVEILVGNVNSKVKGLSSAIAANISQTLSVKVPNCWFSKKFKQGVWDGYIRFFMRPQNTFPSGLLEKVCELLIKYEVEYKITDLREHKYNYILQTIPYGYEVSEGKILRDYQVDTINSVITKRVGGLDYVRGVINMATNAGKTVVATAILQQLYPQLVSTGEVFLFVTHSKEIANQAKKTFETDLGEDIGFIGEGLWDIKPVTVALIPTLYRRIQKPEFKKLSKQVTGFIADECHHSSSDSFYKVFNEWNKAYIRLGLTGTVDKKNIVNERKLYSCTGYILSKVSNKFLIGKGYSAVPHCILFTVTAPECGHHDYYTAYDWTVVGSTQRYNYIVEICRKELSENKTVLILVEKIEHGKLIEQVLDEELAGNTVIFTHGSLSSEHRELALNAMKNDYINVLIATSILDEGVDISNINSIIYARGMKSTRKLLQGIGRGLRKKTDGSKLRFYDFIDDTHEILLNHSLERYKTLKKEGFKISSLTLEEYLKLDINEL